MIARIILDPDVPLWLNLLVLGGLALIGLLLLTLLDRGLRGRGTSRRKGSNRDQVLREHQEELRRKWSK